MSGGEGEMGGWGKEKTAGGVERGRARHVCAWACMCIRDRVLQTYRQEESGGSEVGEVGRNRQEGGWPHRRETWRDEWTAPPFSAPLRWFRPPELRSWLRQRTWQPPNLCRMKPDFPRQPCTLGARRGHFNLRQQQWASACGPCQPGRERQRWGREASLRFRSVGYYQHLLVEPGYSAHPCRHRMGNELVWVP